MKTETITATEYRIARAWYVKYPLDAYALGPYRFEEPVSAVEVVELAEEQFGAKPSSLWPDGPSEEVAEYEFEIDTPVE